MVVAGGFRVPLLAVLLWEPSRQARTDPTMAAMDRITVMIMVLTLTSMVVVLTLTSMVVVLTLTVVIPTTLLHATITADATDIGQSTNRAASKKRPRRNDCAA